MDTVGVVDALLEYQGTVNALSKTDKQASSTQNVNHYITVVVVVAAATTTTTFVFTTRCTIVQSVVLRSHVVCLSVRL